jgi:hypothetical protein
VTSDPTLFGIVLNFKNWRASRRWKKPLDSSKSRDLALSDFALRFGLALAVVTVASAAVIISRRNYAKSANLERNIDALDSSSGVRSMPLKRRLSKASPRQFTTIFFQS